MLRFILFFSLLCDFHLLPGQANVYHPFPLAQSSEWRSDYFSIDCIDQSYSLCASWNFCTDGDTTIDVVEEFHGGKVFVKESTVGKGTTFRIVLKG